MNSRLLFPELRHRVEGYGSVVKASLNQHLFCLRFVARKAAANALPRLYVPDGVMLLDAQWCVREGESGLSGTQVNKDQWNRREIDHDNGINFSPTA